MNKMYGKKWITDDSDEDFKSFKGVQMRTYISNGKKIKLKY